MIILHIGLPKTATTFLQTSFFPLLTNTNVILRRNSPGQARFCKNFSKVVRTRPALQEECETVLLVQNRLKRLNLRAVTQLISWEGLTINAKEFWDGNGISPDSFANNLNSILSRAGIEKNDIAIIVGIRRQSQWICSRYAQSSFHYPRFSQADFERRLDNPEKIMTSESSKWLSYDKALNSILRVCPEENLYFLPIETLSQNPSSALLRLTSWIESIGNAKVEIKDRDKNSPKKGVRNKLSVSPGVWSLRNENGLLAIDEAKLEQIDNYFRHSNSVFAEASGLDLAQLGYACNKLASSSGDGQ
jgi:hypothetical protein